MIDNLLLTAAQMRVLETAAIDSGAVTGLELMERAGLGAVDAILDEWPQMASAPGRAVVLCGPGNNGGDGFVVARLLAGKGWDVDVFLYGDAAKLPPDARVNHKRWSQMGEVRAWDDHRVAELIEGLAGGLVVDALFGIGLSRPMPDDTRRTWHAFMPDAILARHAFGARHFVALDIPSGLCADSGRNLEGAFPAQLTVAFGARKIGHVLDPVTSPTGGASWCGRLRVVDLGLDRFLDAIDSVGPMVARQTSVEMIAPIVRKAVGHKFDHGHALIPTGGMGRTGAARLAARGALRIGAGMVTCAAPGAAMLESATQLTAIMLRRCDKAADLRELLTDPRINALCLGPGMGLSERTDALIDVALDSGRPLVLDADALTLLARRAEPFAMLHDTCVLTPHGGEFARLFPDLAARLAAPATEGPAFSKVDATREAAARAGCTVLFKGADTVIADAKGATSVNAALYDRAVPWLATAGAGDVLAGIITGLLARGVYPVRAAATAAWLHVEAARAVGPGLIAEDLSEALPGVLRALEGG